MHMNPNQIDGARVVRGPGAPNPVSADRSIGAMLIDAGKITPEESERILRHSRERSMRFGDAAIELRIVQDEDIRQVLARQFDYPYLMPGQSNVSTEVVAAWQPFGPQVEAMRALRSQLLLRWFTDDSSRRTLSVLSPRRGEGKTHLAANLAVVFSQMGERTLLVDADLRNPRQHELFALDNAKGLSTMLAERSGMEGVQRIGAFVDLSVLPSGPTPPNPLELLGRSAFGDLISEFARQYDVIILDTPAAEFGSDYQLIVAKTWGGLIVARKGRSKVVDCRNVVEGVAATNAVVVGSVINEY